MSQRKPKKNGRRHKAKRSPHGLSLRRAADGSGWVFIHPRCVRDRAEDLDDVRSMIAAGEPEIAIDELRWLLSGCSEFLEAHVLLGELALSVDQDVPLARGHFGFAFQLGVQALRRAGMQRPLVFGKPANRPFFDAAYGLTLCLHRLGKTQVAQEVVETVVNLEPTDPLQLRKKLDELRTKGLPMTDLLQQFPQRPHNPQHDTES